MDFQIIIVGKQVPAQACDTVGFVFKPEITNC